MRLKNGQISEATLDGLKNWGMHSLKSMTIWLNT